MPLADDDDDWLGSLLTQEAVKPVEPAPVDAWKDQNSKAAQLRHELVAELQPKPSSSIALKITPTVNDNEEDISTAETIAPPSDPPSFDAEIDSTSNQDQPTVVSGLDPSTAPDFEQPITSSTSPAELSASEVQSLVAGLDEPQIQQKAPDLPAARAAIAKKDLSMDDARAACPAGQPKPKIDLSSMQKAKTSTSTDQVARFFSGERPPAADPDDENQPRTKLSFEIPTDTPQKPSRLLQALDQCTDRVRKVHSSLPVAAGLAGVALIGHSLLIVALATLGWI
jgi:hypothetical protein